MKTIISICLVTTVMLSLQVNALACNVCHSKNPKMVNMHRELGFKDCFNCHPGSKKSAEEQRLQMTEDERCVRCHKK